MKLQYGLVFISILMAIALIPPGAAAETTGGDQGWYVIHCNAYGAYVYIDDKYVGTVEQGTLTVPASTTGTPYKVIRVQKFGYSTFTDSITEVPDKGAMVNLYATLNPLPSTTQTNLGGEMGWYIVHSNIDGASVFFDSANKGEISRGVVYVPVYSTGTPYKSFTVKKEGYSTFTGTVSRVPVKGETIDLYATLNPLAVTTTATPGPIGGDIGWYQVHSNVEGATVSFDNEPKGQITEGNLSVRVYVTGTPYKTYMVYKAGYVPFSGTIDQYPRKGETVDLYATLNAQPAMSTAATTKSPLPFEIVLFALVICGIGVVASRKKNNS